jgi:hypothetical protein
VDSTRCSKSREHRAKLVPATKLVPAILLTRGLLSLWRWRNAPVSHPSHSPLHARMFKSTEHREITSHDHQYIINQPFNYYGVLRTICMIRDPSEIVFKQFEFFSGPEPCLERSSSPTHGWRTSKEKNIRTIRKGSNSELKMVYHWDFKSRPLHAQKLRCCADETCKYQDWEQHTSLTT